jgi:putative peptidoglycan lipid II flippase
MKKEKAPFSKSGAHLVAAGIFLSRIMGLVRQKIFAHYFGNSDAGDAFYAALKIPNFSQNLLGDGVLSASFIPVYANMLAKGDSKAADKIAGIIGSILAVINAILSLAGILAAPFLIDLIAPGFEGEKRELTIKLVQIFFPATGLLVMSAWCLGILNSHRKFFLSYVAPVFWNLAIISALLFFGRAEGQNMLAVYTAWAVLAGSFLQLGVQLPSILKYAPHLKPGLNFKLDPVKRIFKSFVPVVMSRGVVQISAYIDSIIGSLLPSGAVSALAYAQSLYMLPISLFGMSVSAAELPAMSSLKGSDDEIAQSLRKRINAGLKQIAFFVIPSTVAFLILGDVVISGVLQGGVFQQTETHYVWGVLAGSTVGLLATTLGRLYSSAFYSLKDTRTPLNYAILRVILTTVLGYIFGLKLPGFLGISESWGTAGLTASAGLAGWLEFILLRRGINEKVGETSLALTFQLRVWGSALTAALIAYCLKNLLADKIHYILKSGIVLGVYGLLYFVISALLGVEESQKLRKKFF